MLVLLLIYSWSSLQLRGDVLSSCVEWGCCWSPGTAEMGTDFITPSACVEEEVGGLKQAASVLLCHLSLPKLCSCREKEYPPATFPGAFLHLHFPVNWKSNKTREKGQCQDQLSSSSRCRRVLRLTWTVFFLCIFICRHCALRKTRTY